MKKTILTFVAIALMSMVNAQSSHVLDRFLNYVEIESQSVDDPDPESFPITEGQIEIAKYIYDELKSIDEDNSMDIKLSPDYYIYVKVPSNITEEVPSIMFMAHLDVTPEANGKGIKPQIHYNYNGGDIALRNGLVLTPDMPEGRHLKDVIGKTIITTDGSTLLGADCKAGCTILVTLIEQMANDKSFKHGDVYFSFSQNEDVGKAAMRMDMSYFDRTPDILIDVDGDDYGEFSMANFTAEGRTYYFKGNQAHTSQGKALKYADARTAMAYFIGQLPPEMHPSYSEGRQGYLHCYNMEMLPNGHDVRIRFRIRYFDKADGEQYKAALDEAYRKTTQAYPFVEVSLENEELQYENVAYNMHPQAVELIERAAEKTGMPMKGVELRAGTTGALMVAKGLPGGPCIYSAQQAVHSVYEWCCLEEMMEVIELTRNIVTEASKLSQTMSETTEATSDNTSLDNLWAPYSNQGNSLICLGNFSPISDISVFVKGVTDMELTIKARQHIWIEVPNGFYHIYSSLDPNLPIDENNAYEINAENGIYSAAWKANNLRLFSPYVFNVISNTAMEKMSRDMASHSIEELRRLAKMDNNNAHGILANFLFQIDAGESKQEYLELFRDSSYFKHTINFLIDVYQQIEG